jgi:hypothetical protein
MSSFFRVRSVLSCIAIVGLIGCGGAGDADETVGTTQQALTSTWTPLTNAPPGFLDTCNLLTDGTVACHEYNSNVWHRLSPDAFGSYANGTWDTPPIAPMPNGNDPSFGCVNCAYRPLYFASAVLADGRLVVIGGEYNNLTPVWTNIGFIYNPVTNTWSSQLAEAFGGGRVGDTSGIVLQDGTFILADIFSGNVESLNLATQTFTPLNPPGKLDINNEENWNILYDGSVLTVDSRIVASFERYNPATNTWGNSGSTVVNLADTGGPPVGNSAEVGPCVMRADSRGFCFSGNSLGQNALYDFATNTFSHAANMDFPLVPGQTYHYAIADGAASLLPNGNILAMASPVINGSPFNPPSHFYEVDFATNTLGPVTDSPNAAAFTAYQARMLLLPTGEVLLTAYNQGATQDVMLYTNGGAPQAAWRPVITAAPTAVVAGTTYSISGTLFNGFSEGASYGDDAQSSTNYPLVRITNNATGHTVYARTHNHSRMGIEQVGSTEVVTTQFDAPAGLEAGPSTLVVVVNGIPSLPLTINGNQPPVVRCQDVAVEAGGTCTVAVTSSQVNNGSFDPEGSAVTCVLTPTGPFSVGSTSVTLTCTDAQGTTGTCSAFVRVGVGDNAACCPAGTNVILGNASNNTLTGTPGNDCIIGFGGGDTINGLGGNDIISGGEGEDVITCGNGNDLAFGGPGQDRLSGDAGNDVLAGGDGDDQCFGGDGDDALLGGQGQDRLFGDAGNDRLTGNIGDDRLEGGAGADFLDGSGMHDVCIGGPDTDTFGICESQTQ